MTAETIMRSEAIRIINKGLPFTLSFVTADRRRGTGGDLITVKKWMKLREGLPADQRPAAYQEKHQPLRDSNNHLNKTIRIFNPGNRRVHPITVHYRLMQELNGKRIING